MKEPVILCRRLGFGDAGKVCTAILFYRLRDYYTHCSYCYSTAVGAFFEVLDCNVTCVYLSMIVPHVFLNGYSVGVSDPHGRRSSVLVYLTQFNSCHPPKPPLGLRLRLSLSFYIPFILTTLPFLFPFSFFVASLVRVE